MFRIAFLTIAVWLATDPCCAQERYAQFSATVQDLYDAPKSGRVDSLWNMLLSLHRIPLVAGDSVAFLFRGNATSVAWMGDFNGWGNSKTFQNKGSQIPGSNIWILRASLPEDARLDYKVLVNNRDLILDPSNPVYQWSGVGGGSMNSELRMPACQDDPLTVRRLDYALAGHLEQDLLISSLELGYQVTYSIYRPAGYVADKGYPIVYVTDGYEYMHERMGNMTAILDNLIYLQRIEPVVAVFIDHREPVNRSNNRRMQELGVNEKYMRFLLTELIPAVESTCRTDSAGRQRAIIGTSLGALTAAWISLRNPGVFAKLGIQSPAFWFKSDVYTLFEMAGTVPDKIFLSTGLIHDTEEGVRKMREILDRKGHAYAFKAVNQGHSWGNWRDLTDDMLVYLFAGPD